MIEGSVANSVASALLIGLSLLWMGPIWYFLRMTVYNHFQIRGPENTRRRTFDDFLDRKSRWIYSYFRWSLPLFGALVIWIVLRELYNVAKGY